MATPTVLLLEDEPIIAADLSAMLGSLGCEVLQVADSREALALCALRRPDWAMLNFCQPDGADGMALARILRADAPVKVFFVTGARKQDLEASPNFNADHTVLYKPFTKREVKAVLAQMIP